MTDEPPSGNLDGLLLLLHALEAEGRVVSVIPAFAAQDDHWRSPDVVIVQRDTWLAFLEHGR